ncbi:MAG: hypothetical protein A2428_01385 [Bdellovibrionales bacterium RIFOXYC1_FULL_54_43]|nr:MAG: hypothetical protein A2428_01385 [Bdellovibrionales bacterium RIFOXYC1_FULL_54_43]OFZ85252.1 MAG: hypothetical protein A2603_08140 [Bdellovibrionales bacterium RIFOXYD1_FULL_55_31]
MSLKAMARENAVGSDHEDGAIMAEINITPLTDIFLVLLIIFMVTSSVMSQLGVNVNLPKASHSIAESQAEGVIITLLPGGKVQINQRAVSLSDTTFEKSLKSAFEKTSSRLVILEGDRETFLGSAIEIMDRARKEGADRFAIATMPAAQKSEQ